MPTTFSYNLQLILTGTSPSFTLKSNKSGMTSRCHIAHFKHSHDLHRRARIVMLGVLGRRDNDNDNNKRDIRVQGLGRNQGDTNVRFWTLRSWMALPLWPSYRHDVKLNYCTEYTGDDPSGSLPLLRAVIHQFHCFLVWFLDPLLFLRPPSQGSRSERSSSPNSILGVPEWDILGSYHTYLLHE